jgi:hypothetical protein
VRIVTPVPPVAYFLKHFVAAGKTVTARQINQVRPRPSRVNGIAPGLLNDAVAKNDASSQIVPRPGRSVHLKPETLAAQGAGAADPAGMAAATAAFLSLERPAHVVAPSAMYWGLRECLKEDAPGIGDDFRRRGDNEARRAGRGKSALCGSRCHQPRFGTVAENAEAARCAHGRGALLAMDSTTVLTPLLTRPIPSSNRSQCSDGCGRNLATLSAGHTFLLSM